MRALLASSVLLIAAALALPACSFIGITDLDIPTCSAHEDCDVLNDPSIRGLPWQGREAETDRIRPCGVWQCSSSPIPGIPADQALRSNGTCVFRDLDLDSDGEVNLEACLGLTTAAVDCDDLTAEQQTSGVETCDGLDNDCDGTVDEHFREESGAYVEAIQTRAEGGVTGVPPGSRISMSGTPRRELVASWGDGSSRGSFAFVGIPSTLEAQAMSYVTQMDADNLRMNGLTAGCPRDPMRTGSSADVVAGSCNFGEVAVALTDQYVFTASVNRLGCTRGELLIGHFSRDAEPNVILRGPARRSNSYLGIDNDPMLDCAQPMGMELPPEQLRGAARPAIAVIDADGTDEDQGLVAWVHDTFERDACGGPEADVMVIASYLQEGMFGMPFTWTTASGEGQPQAIGRTVGGRPRVVAWSRRGYFVTHPDEMGRIQIHFVPPAAPPPEYNGFACEAATCSGPDDRTGLATADLSGIVSLPPIATMGGSASEVELSVGAIRADGRVEVGIAWREGCGTASQQVFFRMLTLEQDTAAGTIEIVDMREVQTVTDAEGTVDAPPIGDLAIAYAPEGFLTDYLMSQFPREDGRARPAIGANPVLGGWMVAWTERDASGQHAYARRYAEFDGRPVVIAGDGVPEERIELAAQDRQELGEIELYTATGIVDEGFPRIYFAMNEGNEGRILHGGATCDHPRAEDM